MTRNIGPKWKKLYESPNHEISEEGQVRVIEGFNAGRVLARYRASWNAESWNGGTQVKNRDQTTRGSLCVDIYNNGHRRTYRIWKLMEKYWPEIEYPEDWRLRHNKTRPRRGEPMHGFKVTKEDWNEIVLSNEVRGDIARKYGISASHVSQIRKKGNLYDI